MAKAMLLQAWRRWLSEEAFVEGVIWRVARPVEGSSHHYKYRLALVARDVCVLRFDNERGKGDHKHVGDVEVAYMFRDPETLIQDFYAEVAR